RLKAIRSGKNEEKMGVVNLHRKEGGHFQPDLGGQYHRILHSIPLSLCFSVSLSLCHFLNSGIP
ncbi:MAG: hypothetical protein ABSD71_11875, partial [Bacteroidales bacterium]